MGGKREMWKIMVKEKTGMFKCLLDVGIGWGEGGVMTLVFICAIVIIRGFLSAKYFNNRPTATNSYNKLAVS